MDSKSYLQQARVMLAGLGPRQRVLAAVLILAALAGAGWLALASVASPATVAVAGPLDGADLAAAQAALCAKDIPFHSESGKILVTRENSARARAALAEQGLLDPRDLGGMEKLAAQDDIWCTQAQAAKRWQAAKMATLARLIRKFPQIGAATVLFEEGTPRGLGGAGVESTASVQVELKPNLRMTAQLASAITDLVCGSVAGLKPVNVRIIDSSGRSYRTPAADGMDALAAAEGYYCDKIRSALAYIGEPIVTVQADVSKTPARCTGVWVSIPRGYLLSVAQAQYGAGAGDKEFASALAATVEKTQQVVRNAIGVREAIEIQVDWHHDAPAQASVSKAAHDASAWVIALAVGAVVVVTLGIAAMWRRGGRNDVATGDDDAPVGAARNESTAADAAASPLGMLQLASVEELCEFLAAEHPQTIAVVLSQLGDDKAGAILAALAPEVQADVSRRIASLEKVDRRTLQEVERALAGRLPELASRSQSTCGEQKLAQMLKRAGPEAEGNVMQSLARGEPGVAASVRNRLFAFEDIISLGEANLAPVLESMDARQLAIALRTASRELAQKVLGCLSAPAAKRLRSQMEKVGPVRLSDVETAQQRAVAAIVAAREGQYVAASSPEVVA